MSGLFHRLALRAQGLAPTLSPRVPGPFEPEEWAPAEIPFGVDVTPPERPVPAAANQPPSTTAVSGSTVAQRDVVPAAALDPAGESAPPPSRPASPRGRATAASPPRSRSPQQRAIASVAPPPLTPEVVPGPRVRARPSTVTQARVTRRTDSVTPPASAPRSRTAAAVSTHAVDRGRAGTEAGTPAPPVAGSPSIALDTPPRAEEMPRTEDLLPTDAAASAPAHAAPDAGAGPAGPVVEITIGRVEIRVVPPAPPAAPRMVAPPSLDVLLARDR